MPKGCPRCSTPGMVVDHFVPEMCPKLPPCERCGGVKNTFAANACTCPPPPIYKNPETD